MFLDGSLLTCVVRRERRQTPSSGERHQEDAPVSWAQHRRVRRHGHCFLALRDLMASDRCARCDCELSPRKTPPTPYTVPRWCNDCAAGERRDIGQTRDEERQQRRAEEFAEALHGMSIDGAGAGYGPDLATASPMAEDARTPRPALRFALAASGVFVAVAGVVCLVIGIAVVPSDPWVQVSLFFASWPVALLLLGLAALRRGGDGRVDRSLDRFREHEFDA